MGLTVAEKTHWKERIGKRIEHRVETLVARQDPTLLQRVSEAARQRAYESLGIDSQQRELEQLEKQKQEIERRERRLKAEQRVAINGTSLEEELERSGYYSRHDQEVENAVKARAKALEARAQIAHEPTVQVSFPFQGLPGIRTRVRRALKPDTDILLARHHPLGGGLWPPEHSAYGE